ncbi:MAG: FAD-dependent oxidoreductase [Oscillospiraceae bacterium]|nr:FAD-dependent oxidoreductase [Oscillospiraceae bacterium]
MYDIVIIGSGPAGLSAAVYASRAQFSAVVAEKDYMGAGQIAASEQVDNYLGLPGINGFELGEKFREHAVSLGAEFFEGEVSGISKNAESYTVSFKDGSTLESRCIIYAAGTSYRRLEIPGGELLGVSYCATCDGAFYKGKTAAVVGGGDTALGDALYLSKIAEKVYLIHRRDTFRANKALQELVKKTRNIEVILNAVPTKVMGEKRVEGLEISVSGETRNLEVNGVFVAIGSVPNTGILDGICDLDQNGYIIADEDGITSSDGFFAAGDVRTKALRQVVTAVSDGANCVLSAENYINNW